jgi:hypothetical protein
LGDPGLAAMQSNHHYRIDYSEATLVEKLVRDANFTSVVAGCNEFAAFTAARIADKLHTVNHDSLWQTTQIHLKDNFRGLCARFRIPSSRFFAITDDEDFGANRLERLTFPVIVKPVDLTGGKGIILGSEGSVKWVQLDPENLRLRGTGGSEQIVHRGTVDCIVASLPRYNRFKAGHPDGFIQAFANTYADIAMRLDDPTKGQTPFTYADEFCLAQSAMLLATLEAAVEAARTRREVGVAA